MAAFYMDENVPPELSDAVRALGHDVLIVQAEAEIGQEQIFYAKAADPAGPGGRCLQDVGQPQPAERAAQRHIAIGKTARNQNGIHALPV